MTFCLSILILSLAFAVGVLTLCVPFALYMVSRLFWPGCTVLWDGKIFGISLANEPEKEKSK